MDFTDTAFVLSARRHGEGDVILSCLTRDHGRHLGLVKGGASRRSRPLLEIGNALAVQWRARLAEQLGYFQVELLAAHAALLLDDADRLAALNAAAAVIDATLPERAPHADIYADFADLVAALAGGAGDWGLAYLRWELRILADLGFGLDLSSCAVTGATDGLAFVSPKTGRAVTAAGAGRYAGRLLPLPQILCDPAAPVQPGDIQQGLRLTGHFLHAHLIDAPGAEKRLTARDRLVERVGR
ncbi:DNA replication and repair protein RecO [Dongia mobilis]|uniref:DNA repair protein RecO n=1 Tax=Dongia mobilis TaxID=578943 RepID=A0A4R6WSE2_9PROT|nr:DNA repair protein RecO [Dongia mobilis]TDQ82537.1 DNA replication and repair protein RecO [Dongia mobilis]